MSVEKASHCTEDSFDKLSSGICCLTISDVSTPKTDSFFFGNPSTPKTNRKKPSADPFTLSKAKKSKRRTCTPAYSPLKEPEEIFHAKTELREPLFCEKFGNIPKKSKKNFLELIEESLNEVNDNYLSVLCSQATPDNVFSTLFNDNKENPEKKNSVGEEVISRINEIIKELNNKTYQTLFKVIIIQSDCSVKEIENKVFKKNLSSIAAPVDDAIMGEDGKIYIPGNIVFGEKKANDVQGREGRLIFEVDEEKKIELSSIEIHCF